jgi:hypothetical protein
MHYFFSVLPVEYLHHDDRINPRGIGTNIRGLIEEFMKKRPQLHVSLAWWAPENGSDSGQVKVFDGQHKAAAQILLGVNKLPVRVFVNPDTNVLLAANTNAGDKLRQVAFDAAVMRHLGSTLVTVGMPLTRRPPCRSVRAELPHTAPALGDGGENARWAKGGTNAVSVATAPECV